jgi:hypothetical protein
MILNIIFKVLLVGYKQNQVRSIIQLVKIYSFPLSSCEAYSRSSQFTLFTKRVLTIFTCCILKLSDCNNKLSQLKQNNYSIKILAERKTKTEQKIGVATQKLLTSMTQKFVFHTTPNFCDVQAQ